ncbi:MAG TPA: hypothetical protein DEA08_18255 [Planctomycetes bacterium]|nr:hypothetical protein [Planctomycetota bacterium]
MKPTLLHLCLAPCALLAACASPEPQPAAPEPTQASAPGASESPAPPERAVALEDIPHLDEVLGAAFSRAGVESLFRAERLELHGIICEREADPGEPYLCEAFPFPIRSTAKLTTPASRAEVLGAFFAGVAAPGPLAMCFEPHHALVATTGDEQIVIQICYSCGQYQIDKGEQSLGSGAIGEAGSEVLNRVLGQTHTVPPGELEGRPLAYWLERFRAGVGKAEPSELEERAVDLIDDCLTSGELPQAELRLVLAAQRARLEHDRSAVCAVLQRTISDSRHEPARREVLSWVAELAQRPPSNSAYRARLLELADATWDLLSEPLPEPPLTEEQRQAGVMSFDEEPTASPELRALARKTLATFRWAPADQIAWWHEEAAAVEDPQLRKQLLLALKPLPRASD